MSWGYFQWGKEIRTLHEKLGLKNVSGGITVNPPGDAQKTGMEDAASRPRFRAVQHQGTELLQ